MSNFSAFLWRQTSYTRKVNVRFVLDQHA